MTSPISPATFAFTAVNAELASSALQSEGMVASALESGEPTAAQQDLGRLVEGRTVPTPSLRPSPRAKGGWFAGLLLGAMALVGCEFHVEPLDVVVDAGISADGGDAGNVRDGGGDGGMDGGGMVLGTQYIPTGVSPGLGSRMTPSRAFLHWSPPSAIPSGRTLAGYDACWVAGTVLDLGDETQCPNAVNTPNTYGVIGSLNAGAQYFWKVRARYQDGSTSYYSSAQPFLTDHSLVGWLKMDEGMGATTADGSGSGNNGTLVNAPMWVAGYIGQGLQFGGMSYVSVADGPALNFGTGDFSLSAEVRTSFTGARQAIVEKVESGNGYYFYILSTGVLGFFGSNCGVAVSGGNVSDGMWHRVMATRSGPTVTLYVDGTMTGSGTCADNFSNTSPLTVGCNSPSLGCVDPFHGTIDDVMITNTANTNALNDDCAASEASGADPLARPACAL